MKLRALPYAGIGLRFYDILQQETPLRPNTEPQGVPEALDRFFLHEIVRSSLSRHRHAILPHFTKRNTSTAEY